MTGSFTTYMCHAYHSASGVFNGSKKGNFKWANGGYFDATQYNFNGSSGFSGYTSSAGAHSHTMALDNSGGNAAHNNMRLYYVNTHSGSTSSAGSHDHSRGTIGNSMTGSAAAYAWNDRSITGQSSGVFSWGGETTLNAGGSWSGSRTRTLNFNGSSGFSGCLLLRGTICSL